MNTIHTSSLTHEIESYGNRADLLQFIRNRYEELSTGGVWVNRDVVAPYNKDEQVLLLLNKTDGVNENIFASFTDRHRLSEHLQSLSTYARFLRFAKDFRAKEGYRLSWQESVIEHTSYIQLSLADAAEFLSRKDYTDNWESEMHETFCFWDFEEWKTQLQQAGFHIHSASHAFTNTWITENRWKGKADLFTVANGKVQKMNYPVTHMILVGVR